MALYPCTGKGRRNPITDGSCPNGRDYTDGDHDEQAQPNPAPRDDPLLRPDSRCGIQARLET